MPHTIVLVQFSAGAAGAVRWRPPARPRAHAPLPRPRTSRRPKRPQVLRLRERGRRVRRCVLRSTRRLAFWARACTMLRLRRLLLLRRRRLRLLLLRRRRLRLRRLRLLQRRQPGMRFPPSASEPRQSSPASTPAPFVPPPPAGVVKLYEAKLKQLNPQVRQITYDISDLFSYIDSLGDLSALVCVLSTCLAACLAACHRLPQRLIHTQVKL